MLITATHDAVLYEDASGGSANGGGDYLLAGRTNQSIGSRRRTVLAFDLASIPPETTIISAAVQLQALAVATTSEVLSLHRLLASWTTAHSDPAGNESAGVAALLGDATWLYSSYPSTTWAVPGGDHTPVASANLEVGPLGGAMMWSSPAMTADVQAWLNNPSTNHGWLLRSNETTPQTAKRFISASNLDPALRPVLMIEYRIIPEPSSTLTAMGAFSLLLWSRRRYQAFLTIVSDADCPSRTSAAPHRQTDTSSTVGW